MSGRGKFRIEPFKHRVELDEQVRARTRPDARHDARATRTRRLAGGPPATLDVRSPPQFQRPRRLTRHLSRPLPPRLVAVRGEDLEDPQRCHPRDQQPQRQRALLRGALPQRLQHGPPQTRQGALRRPGGCRDGASQGGSGRDRRRPRRGFLSRARTTVAGSRQVHAHDSRHPDVHGPYLRASARPQTRPRPRPRALEGSRRAKPRHQRQGAKGGVGGDRTRARG